MCGLSPTEYDNSLNHRQWLETVPPDLRRYVAQTITDWDSQADAANSWHELGWDERDELLAAQARKQETGNT